MIPRISQSASVNLPLFPHTEPALWLPHSWRWGSAMWKYVLCFASSPPLDLSCSPCSLFPPPNASTELYVYITPAFLCAKKTWIKGHFSTCFFFPLVIYQTQIKQSQKWHIFHYFPPLPPSLSLAVSGHFVGVGIIYCGAQRLKEWAGAQAFNLPLGILRVTCFTAVCLVQERLNLFSEHRHR